MFHESRRCLHSNDDIEFKSTLVGKGFVRSMQGKKQRKKQFESSVDGHEGFFN